MYHDEVEDESGKEVGEGPVGNFTVFVVGYVVAIEDEFEGVGDDASHGSEEGPDRVSGDGEDYGCGGEFVSFPGHTEPPSLLIVFGKTWHTKIKDGLTYGHKES